MSTTNSPPGLMKPSQIGMVGSSPQNSAFQTQQAMNQKQAALASVVGGKRRKRGGAVVVPQMNMPYPVTNGPGQDPNSQMASNSQTSMQSTANSANDNKAMQLTGGSVKWGCYSGGIKRTRTRRTRRTTRSYKRKRNHKKRKTTRRVYCSKK
jgi:hypothetical protein